MKPKYLIIGFAILLSFVLVASIPVYPAFAEARPAGEYELKAAFIYHFAKFVEWPPEAMPVKRDFILGILGEDPFRNEIDAMMAGKVLSNGSKVIVRRYKTAEDAIKECHALFIGSLAPQGMKQVLTALEGKPILTLSEAPGFEESGGMIRFVMDQNKVRFMINRAAAEKSGLKVSSQLLKLAKRVVE